MKKLKQNSRRKFIKNSVAASAVFGFSDFLPFDTIAEPGKKGFPNSAPGKMEFMKAGYAEGDISPEIGMEQPGNYGKSYHTTFHDPCKVRVSVLEDGATKLILIGVDALALYSPLIENVRNQINAACGVPQENILIGASHSHSSGPTAMVQPGEFDHADEFVQFLAYEKSSCADPKYLDFVEKQMIKTTCEAVNSIQEVTMGIGIGREDTVSFNRRFKMKNGLTYTHPGQLNPDILEVAGPIDPDVGVIGTWDKEGKCIGCIVNFACHTTTNPGGTSANWVYYMEQTIKGAMGAACVVVFLQGASGDVTQVDNLNPDVNRSGEAWARFVGAKVGAEAVKVLLDMPRGILLPLNSKSEVVRMGRRVPEKGKVEKSYELARKDPEEVGATEWTFAKEIVLLDSLLKKEKASPVEIQVLQVGPAVFVSNPAEFFCQLGIDIKKQSHFPFTFPVSMANGCVGYVPTKEAFDLDGGGYETRLTAYSYLEIDAGNKMVDLGVKLVRKLKPGSVPKAVKAPPFKGQPWSYGNVKPELG